MKEVICSYCKMNHTFEIYYVDKRTLFNEFVLSEINSAISSGEQRQFEIQFNIPTYIEGNMFQYTHHICNISLNFDGKGYKIVSFQHIPWICTVEMSFIYKTARKIQDQKYAMNMFEQIKKGFDFDAEESQKVLIENVLLKWISYEK